jgi:hypothetical protein
MCLLTHFLFNGPDEFLSIEASFHKAVGCIIRFLFGLAILLLQTLDELLSRVADHPGRRSIGQNASCGFLP